MATMSLSGSSPSPATFPFPPEHIHCSHTCLHPWYPFDLHLSPQPSSPLVSLTYCWLLLLASAGEIVPEECTYKRLTNKVTITLKKANTNSWSKLSSK